MFGLGKKREASSEDIARLLIPRLQALRGDRTYKFEGATDLIRTSDGASINVLNLRAEYLKAPEAMREQVLDRFAQAMTPPQIPKTLDAARANLLPAFRNLAELDIARIHAGLPTPEAITHGLLPFTHELAINVVYDTPHSMMMVDDATFMEWGVTAEQAYAVALENLKRRSPPKFVEIAPGLWRGNFGDEYDAARLLLTDLIAGVRVKGTPIAMVPNRACLLVAGADDVQAVSAMLRVAAKFLLEEARPLGSELLMLHEGRWRAMSPDGALGTNLRHLRMQVRGGQYQGQQNAIEQVYRRQDNGTFVATYRVGQKPDGALFNYATLTRGVPTSLPKTDYLVLIEDPHAQTAPPKIVAWEDFAREAAHLLESLPYALPRFHAKDYPDAATLARMPAVNLAGT